MKPQVIELQVENKNMDEMNKMITKTNHYQELIKTMEKEKGMKQILVRDETKTKREIQKLHNFRSSYGTEQTKRQK